MAVTASSTAAGAAQSRPAPDPIIDRPVWERLRLAARKGLLQAEGFQLLDELHRLYPEWRAEW